MASVDLTKIQDQIRDRFDAATKGREIALAKSRKIIRSCANAIRAIHRMEFGPAEALIKEAHDELREAEHALGEHPGIFHAGFLQDAQVEFVEANCTLAVVRGEPIPSPEDLGVGDAPYLNGLGDTVGELRRHILDHLRMSDLDRCEELLGAADDIYVVLTTMDYPDAVTHGLRRRTDVARSLLERTRADYTQALSQQRLHDALERHANLLTTETDAT